jgi:hypothetical protein
MATIEITLSEKDIQAACMHWAVTRILNEGRAVSCNLEVTVCNGKPTGTINSVTVFVETDLMARSLPAHIKIEDRPHD